MQARLRVAIFSPKIARVARIQIPIFFDYASTLCYIAWRIVSPLEDELGFTALWKGVPIAMRDHRAKPGRILADREREKVLIVAAETGVAVSPPSAWPDSNAAIEGSEFARDAGRFRPFHDAVFRAVFEEHRDIGDRAVLEDIAIAVGLDIDAFRAALEASTMRPRIEKNRAQADSFSALGYPAFILGDFPLIGIRPIDSMRLILGRYIRMRTAEPGA